MGHISDRLGMLTARDVMTPNVIVVREDDSIESAVAALKAHHISGAPVVDAQGKFTGLLSVSDIVDGLTQDNSDRPQVKLSHDHDTTTWPLFDRAKPEHIASGNVSECMTRLIASVNPDAHLVDVARVMCDGHWHRVPVVDEDNALCGMISTLDVLAALVNAADETA
ncbi:MAG: hypothetical protein CMJ48_02215 [Planctomycetaceae bacterium]|nr:hypothetical protein [Planctomycetaceae bacterium]